MESSEHWRTEVVPVTDDLIAEATRGRWGRIRLDRPVCSPGGRIVLKARRARDGRWFVSTAVGRRYLAECKVSFYDGRLALREFITE